MERNPLFTGSGEFIPLRLSKIETCNHNTSKFTFSFPDENQSSGFSPICTIFIKFKNLEGRFITRPCTPIDKVGTKGHFTLLIKRHSNGLASNYIHSLKIGDYLQFNGPVISYKWSPNLHKHVILFASGTGVAPFFQLITTILDNSITDKTKITFFYETNSYFEIYLKKELDEYKRNHSNQFDIHYFIRSYDCNGKYKFVPNLDTNNSTKGCITKSYIKKYIPSSSEFNDIFFFVCGSSFFINEISGKRVSHSYQGKLTGLLKNLGFDKKQVYKF